MATGSSDEPIDRLLGALHGDERASEGSVFSRRLGKIELWFAGFFVVAMTLLVLASAISRSAGKPLSWTVDLATFCFAWAVFIGADVALRRYSLVSVDFIVERFPALLQRVIGVVNEVLIIAFLVTMIVLGVILCGTTSSRTFSGLPWLSYTWVTLSIPVGFTLMLFTTVERLVSDVRRPKEEVPA